MFSVQRIVLVLLVLVGAATLALGVLTLVLSYRLRKREFVSLRLLGASPQMLRGLIAFETIFVLSISLLCAGGFLVLTKTLSPILMMKVLGG